MFKKIGKIKIGLFWGLVLIGLLPILVLARTTGSSVNIGGTVPSADGGSPAVINPEEPPVPTYLQITPTLGTINQDCGQATISWQTQIVSDAGAVDASASAELGYGVNNDNENIVTGPAGIGHTITLNNLNVGQTYKYYLFSTNGALSRRNSGGSFMAICAIDNPAIKVNPKNQGAEVLITYPAEEDVARVIIRRAKDAPPADPNAGEAIYDGAQLPEALDPFIDPSDTYYYSVFVCNSYNFCSTGVFDQTARRLPEVEGLSAQPQSQKLNLSWNNPVNDPNIDFRLASIRLIKTDAAGCATAGINAGQLIFEGGFNQYTDLNLQNEQAYYYKVFTKNSYGEYSFGRCFSASPRLGPINYCPTDVNVSAGDQKIYLNWSNPINQADDFIFKQIYWQRSAVCVNTNSEGQNVYGGSGQSLTDENLTNGQTYAYSSFVSYNNDQIAGCGCFIAAPNPAENICPECQATDQHPRFNFFVNSGALAILPQNNQLAILTNYNLLVNTARSLAPKPVKLISIGLNNQNYFLALDNSQNLYQTQFRAPAAAGNYSLTIQTIYLDETISTQRLTLAVLPWGYVYEDKDGKEPVARADVLLFQGEQLVAGWGLANPQQTTAGGFFGLMAPNGEYTLKIEKGGYLTDQRRVTVTNNVINPRIRLINRSSLLSLLGKILDNPLVEEINIKYAAPGLAAFSLAAVASGIPWWNFWRFLQYLFFEPFIWIFGRKRKGWGVVFNAINKEPVDLAVVRLYEKNTGKLLQSRVTDQEGRYNFFVDQGEFYLEAGKPGMVFPSLILKDQLTDNYFIDLYHGQAIIVHEGQRGLITANIPLDPEDVKLTDKQILRRYFLHNFRKTLVVVGPVFAIVSLIISPCLETLGFVLLHFALYILFKRLAEEKGAKNWGTVFDAKNKSPLPRAIARIFAPEFNRMLEAQVTDRYGRYGFLAGNNVYFITTSKDGYQDYKSKNIDLRYKKSEEVVGQDVYLKPGAVQKKALALQEAIEPVAVLAEPAPVLKTQSAEKEPGPLEEIATKLNQRAEEEKPTVKTKASEPGFGTVAKETKFG